MKMGQHQYRRTVQRADFEEMHGCVDLSQQAFNRGDDFPLKILRWFTHHL